MSRDLRDLLEETEARIASLQQELEHPGPPTGEETAVAPQLAATTLELTRLTAQVKTLEKKRTELLAAFDAQRGRTPEVVAIVGVCVGGVLARVLWSLTEDASPDEQALTGSIVLVVSVGLFLFRWRRFRRFVP